MTDVAIPERMRSRPFDKRRNLPVPYFVAWLDAAGGRADEGRGEPDFRIVDPLKFVSCIRRKRCWLCGQPLGARFAFVLGPMCAVNRLTSEPPSHRDCAVYALQVCPFMTKPQAQRRERGKPADVVPPPGDHLLHNPGGMALWIARAFSPFRATRGNEGILFNVGEPDSVEWWREGRPATRLEVLAMLTDGFPALLDVARREGDEAVAEVRANLAAVMQHLPPMAPS